MKIAAVSGGTRGIGRSICQTLAEQGYAIAFCHRASDEHASDLKSWIEGRGGECLSMRADVADFDAVKSFAETTLSELGTPSVVVSSAGITADSSLVQMSAQDFNRVIQTNLIGTFNFCKAFGFEMMKARSGAIINIASIAGVFGNRGQTNYAASKAGIIGFSLSLAKEIGPAGVRVNVVAPGFIDTDMTSSLPEKIRAETAARIPLKFYGQPQDVADLVSFLGSERARYITGQVIRVDGGLVI